ncbi:hypothetical protein HQ545_02020 [Candidatus Woesearchaeota archaeon]|nr:hypothetical protein [Candidatus Woesearchaeota archaeon]
MAETVLHYPRLDTVLMVERALKDAELTISKSELQRRLPKQVMRQTLLVILEYLEEKGMIMIGDKGVLWVHNENPKMKKLLEASVDVSRTRGS